MKIIELEQNTPEWLQWRRTKVSATDASCIMGVNPWETAMHRWEKKMGLAPETPTNPAMQRGIDLEPIARELFFHKKGVMFSPYVVEHDEHSWMAASLDGYHNGLNKAVLEIKCAGKVDHQSAMNGIIPKKYYPQLQHQLAVTGCDLLYYFSFDGKDGVTIEVPRNQEYIDTLIEKEKEFYKCMITCTPPDPSERDYNIRTDVKWRNEIEIWKEAKLRADEWKEREELSRKYLIEEANDQNSKGYGVRVQKILRQGAIDYSQIPELKHVNLDQYRKTPSESWRITLDE